MPALLLSVCITFTGCFHTSAKDASKGERILGHPILKNFVKVQDRDGKEKWLGGALSILQDASGIFWVSTPLGVYLYDEKAGQWTTFMDGDRSLLWAEIHHSQDNRVWLRSEVSGVVKFFDGKSLKEDDKLRGRSVKAIFKGLAGKLWFVLEEEVLCYEDRAWSSPIRPPGEIESAYAQMAQRNRKYHSPAVEKLIRAREKKNSQIQALISSLAETKAGLQDRDGFVWLGGPRSLLKLDVGKMEWKVVPMPEKLEGVYHIYEDHKGVLWFSDMYRNVSPYEKQGESWGAYTLFYPTVKDYRPSLMDSISIDDLYQDRQGHMMIATSHGLIALVQDQNRWEVITEQSNTLQDDSVTTIIEDRKGRIWMGTTGGILVLEP